MKQTKLEKVKQQLAIPPMKDRRLRIMWNSNSMWSNSGYGSFQKDLLPRLAKDGWPVAQTAFFGLEGGILDDYKGVKVYPKMQDTWGSDAMVFHGKNFGANAIFTMQDIWPLSQQFLQQMPVWIPYLPIDQDPVPQNILAQLPFAYKIITFSKFGQKALEKAGFSSTLILEGVDTNLFKPMDKSEAKKFFGLPQDKFIVGMVGANKPDTQVPRKGWQEALEAFKMFHDAHPESIFFYECNQPGGFPIKAFADMLGIGTSIFHMDEYISIFHAGAEVMSKLYNAFDILVHPSTTEGFGLCITESMACGTPVIVNNCTSMPELIIPGVTGEICETDRRHLSAAVSWVYFANTKSLYEKMEKLFVTDREEMGRKAREFVVENYNIDTQLKKQWIPLMEQLQKDLLPSIDSLQEKSVQLPQLNTPPK